MLPRRARAPMLATVVFVALALPPSARAGNTVHPRTPVLWPEAPCIQTLDRSVTPNFEFGYEIPAEDTLLSADEFEDSRRHQFIGFCRQWPAGRPPPRYVSLFDLQRSVDAGHETADKLDDPESTLETSVEWAGCWTRITADDDRRPITFADAAQPVVWDTSLIDAGTYLIAGYTWEPPYNLWSRAPWVLRVIDGPEPVETPQAAVAIADTSDTVYPDETLDLPVCVDAEPGSTLTLEWAASKPEQLSWSALDSVALDGPTELVVPFAPPEASLGLTIVLRAAVEQPTGDSYAGYVLNPVIVFAGAGDGDGDGDGDTGDGDGDGNPGDTGDSGTPGDAGETGDGPPVDEGGGRCSLDPSRGNLPGLAIVLGLPVLISLRRRRAAP